MKRFKAGILGTLVVLVLLGNFLAVVAPVPRAVTSNVKLAGIWPQVIQTIFYLMSLGRETPEGEHGGSAG